MEGVIKGLFFDMDGTLADTHRANALAYQRALEQEGYDVTLKNALNAVTSGRGSSDFVPDLVPGISHDELQSVLVRKQKIYPELAHEIVFNSQLINFLKVMKPAHTTVLVTHAKRSNAEHVLGVGNLHELFDHVVVYEDVAAHKPDPAGYLHALKLTGLNADDVIAFEDSNAGIMAAAAAGIKVIKVEMNHAG